MFKIPAKHVRGFASALSKSIGKRVTLQGVGIANDGLAVFSRVHDHVCIEVNGEVANVATGQRFNKRELLSAARLAARSHVGLEVREDTVHVGDVPLPVEDCGQHDALAAFPQPRGMEFKWLTTEAVSAFEYVAPAMSKDAGRASLWCVSVGGGRIAATNGHRLHLADLAAGAGDMVGRFLIEAPAGAALLWALKAGAARKHGCPTCGAKNRSPVIREVIGMVDSAAWRLRVGGVTIAAPHSKLTFPTYEHVMREEDTVTATIDHDVLARVLPAMTARQGKTGALRFTSSNGRLALSATAFAAGDSKTVWDPGVDIGEVSGAIEPTGVDANYLHDALVPGAVLGFVGPLEQIMVRGAGRTGVIMPKRIQ